MPWVPFEYREFYDRPRSIVVRVGDIVMLLESRFREDLDDYDPEYTAYRLPADVDLEGSWERLADTALETLGHVFVDRVVLDETRRRALELNTISQLLPRP